MTKSLNAPKGARAPAQEAPLAPPAQSAQIIELAPQGAAPSPRGRLLAMLSYRRPAGSDTELEFIRRFIDEPFSPHEDAYGNRFVQIGEAPRILWSAHTDSVHKRAGRQGVQIDEEGVISLVHPKSKKRRSNCLGADDAAGCWMLGEMIRAGVEGLYVFHREEEIGGRGSHYIAANSPEILEGIEFAIAFDRKGRGSVITYQGFERCLSDDAAHQIGGLLNGANRALREEGISPANRAFAYGPDDTGLFTDTANYTDLIGECTNISVGYEREHGPTETQDLGHLLALREAVLEADWSTLTAHRKPGEREDRFMSGFDEYGGAYGRVIGRGARGGTFSGFSREYGAYGPAAHTREAGALIEYIRERPVATATFLAELGYSVEDLAAWADDDIAPWHRGSGTQ